MNDQHEHPPYSILAEIYDSVMYDVDYQLWADYIDELIQRHHPDPRTVLELACGTGSLAISLDELDCYDITATDISSAMIQKAREKKAKREAGVTFYTMDFLDITLKKTFDVAVSTFDSVNYLHRPSEISRLLEEVQEVLGPNSLFIFDFTTPRNSIKAIKYLDNEEGHTSDNYRFVRKSRYDARSRIHYNTFEIEKLDAQSQVIHRYTEMHEQRIYSLDEMLDIISKSDYTLVAKYEDFDLSEADENSLRITMVLRCPTVQ